MTGDLAPPPAQAHDPLDDRVLALAGLFQALALVRDVATRGEAEELPLAASLDSLFTLESPSPALALGGAGALTTGLGVLRGYLNPTGPQDHNLTRYAVTLMRLERVLMRRRTHLERIRTRLASLDPMRERHGPLEPSLIDALARLYLETVSTLGTRVLVRGEPAFLGRESNAARIRALLLAGIRATVLWRQVGGSRLGLLLARRRLAERAGVLLANAVR